MPFLEFFIGYNWTELEFWR